MNQAFLLILTTLCGLINLAVAEVGFCSAAPSIIDSGSETNQLYWKVTNPTLSPSHLQDLPGFTRSVFKRDHALITPESHVFSPLPEWTQTSGAYLITPAMGSHFVMYLAKMQENSLSGLPPYDAERFIFVVQGAVTLTNNSGSSHKLMVDSYAYLPPNFHHSIRSDASATLLVFERRHSSLDNLPTEHIVGSTDQQPLLETPGEVFQLRKLIPTSVLYDFNIHIMDFQPGEYLNVKEVHYNQHGLLLLEGQGIYRLGDTWYPVQAGDVIWMAPFVPQWYAALGKTRSRYLLYKDAMSNGVWNGLQICEGAPTVSHLLFADDSMLYARATLPDCMVVKKILQVYEDASGQQVNLQKSSIVFSGSVPASQRIILAEYLGMEVTEKHSKYLGIPTTVGQSRNDTFAYIKDNLAKKLTGWRTKLLSSAGREILIKVIAQAMPLYTMNTYLLPQHLIHELHQLCAKFWWGGTDEKRGMHWRAWDALCKPKAEGGMGFRHLFAFNLAMLAKQGWRIIQNSQSLPARLLKAIYFPHVNFWEAELGSAPSYAWRSILAGRDILRQGIVRQIGDGSSTNIWDDPWLKDTDLSSFYSSRVSMVSELILQPGVWNEPLLRDLFPNDVVQLILSIPLSSRHHHDRWIWSADRKGKFTVKSAYHVARNRVLQTDSSPNPSSSLWNKIWHAPVPGKVKICIWKAASNILPTRSRLSERGIDIDTQCPFCEEEVESPLHALRDCSHAINCFNAAGMSVSQDEDSVRDWLTASSNSNSHSFGLLLIVLWAIWSNRNAKVWEDDAKESSELIPSILGWWLEYQQTHASISAPRSRIQEKWKKPDVGFIKLNTDAACLDGRTGLGGVFRDHEGNCLGCFSKFLPISVSPLMAELMAVLEGFKLAYDKGLSPLVIETDCKNLVEAINTGSHDQSDMGFLLSDLRWGLHLLASARVQFARRSANAAAHSMAKLAINSNDSIEFSSVPPPLVAGILILECND